MVLSGCVAEKYDVEKSSTDLMVVVTLALAILLVFLFV